MTTDTIVLIGDGLQFNGWEPITTRLESWGYEYEIFSKHNSIKTECELGIILNYDEIIPQSTLTLARKGFVLFHSSDLPKGRGWAPIYNTIVRDLPLVQTMLFAVKEVDSGPMIAKARYPLKGIELESEVRYIDEMLTIAIIDDCLIDIIRTDVQGKPQSDDDATYWKRRYPEDSELNPSDSLISMFNHLRGVPKDARSFFNYDGRKFHIELTDPNPSEIKFDDDKLTVEQFY
jgi:methionyl-tRNA formyltransferase